MTRLLVLGRFAVEIDGELRTPGPAKAAQGLKLLVCSGRRMHWEELAEALWPEDSPKRGRVRLRNVLSRIRRSCGDVVVREGSMVVLPSRVEVDAEAFERDAAAALTLQRTDPERSLQLATAAERCYTGPLLPDDQYAPWTVEWRERLRRRYVAVAGLLVADACARGSVDEALVMLERVMDEEPYADEHYALAAELLLDAGRRGSALAVVARGQSLLAEFGLGPSARLAALEARLRGE